MIDQESEYHQALIKMGRVEAMIKELERKKKISDQKDKENFYKWLDESKPVSKADHNKEWEYNRPNSKYLQYRIGQWFVREDTQYDLSKKNIKRYNRKYTNNLGSHHGESRNSRADKMSGHLNDGWLDDARAGVKKFFKQFYTSKRRMFLKNPNNWEKI